MPEAGIKFGQYVLLRRLARGGMAEVFLAQQRGLEGFDRRVAVKRILPHLVDSPDFIKMFLSEARLAAQLTHPNIVHIYDFGKVDGDYFIAMEYVDGVHAGQLFRLGERGNPRPERLPASLVARIGADAAAALHYAHELRGPNGKPLGLVHRDVSPANLMVSFDGTVKLCDFGIAKAAALSDQLTNPGHVKGKYAYMSPEQTTGGPLDGRSDVFSLAIVLWELIAGKTIVGRNDTVEAMRAIRDGKLEPLDKAAPDTPRPLVDALQWALETRRHKRATAADLAQALEGFIKSSPEIATSMQLASWLRPRVPREPTGDHAPVTGVESPGTAAGPGTLAVPGTASATPVPRAGTGGGALIAASRMATPPSEDDAETINMGPPSEIRAAIASRRVAAAAAPAQQRGGPPNVIVDLTSASPHGDAARPGEAGAFERGLRAQTPRPARDDDAGAEDNLADTAYDPDADHGETDRTLRRAREDIDAEHEDGLDDSGEDDIVDTFERRGSKLREVMAKRAPSTTGMPRVVHAMYSDRSDGRNDGRADGRNDGRAGERGRTDVDPPRSMSGSDLGARPREWDEPPADERGDPTVAEPLSRPGGSRRKLPEPTRPPAPRQGGRGEAQAVPVAAAPSSERSAPIVIAPSSERSSPVAMAAPAGVGSSVHPRLPAAGEPLMTAPVRPAPSTLRRGPRVAIAILVLVVLGAISFLIALRTRGHRVEPPPVRDAAHAADGASASVSGSAGSDVAAAGSEAPPAPHMALLEVSTTPAGATVQVGDQTRAAPTRFALAAGRYTITAELAGFESETREVEVLEDEHVVKEIALTKRVAVATTSPPAGDTAVASRAGYLSARTQPYADVYDGGKLIGQTPLAVTLSAGTYTLTFRNPSRAAVQRTVTIAPGKTTKLQFDL